MSVCCQAHDNAYAKRLNGLTEETCETLNAMNIKKAIPNFFTILNLVSGNIGIIEAFQGSLFYAALYLWLGAFFDFIDGFSARLLKISSPLGKQLDSLADLVTFGLLPSVIMYRLIQEETTSLYLPFIAMLITVFSALRLAQFNIGKGQKKVFIGLPTTANAILISTISFSILLDRYAFFTDFIAHPYTLSSLTVLFSFLLVAKIKLMAFKFTTYAWYPNRLKYIFLLCAIVLVATFHVEGIMFAILLYIILSLFFHKSLYAQTKLKNNKKA